MKPDQIYRTVLESMNEAVFVRDLDMNILYINRAAELMTGWAGDEVRGRKCYEIFGDVLGQCHLLCPAQKTISRREPVWHSEGSVKSRSGEERIVQASISPLIEGSGVVGSVVVLADITRMREVEKTSIKTLLALEKEIEERKRAEAALAEKERFLGDVIESVQDGISVLDRELSIRLVNGVMKRWYAGNLPLEGKKCYACYHNAAEPCTWCPTLRCMASGRTEHEVVPGLPGSDAEWLDVYSYPVRERESGEILGAVEFVRDITTTRNLEAHLQQARKMEAIATLAGGIAHEFNNALTSITGSLDLIDLAFSGNEQLHRQTSRMGAAARKMAGLTEQLIAFARGGKGRPQRVSLNRLIEDTWSLIQHAIPSSIEFRMALVEHLPAVEVDPTHIQMVISALVNNALEAIEGQGRIEMSTRRVSAPPAAVMQELALRPGDYVCLTLSDTGSGMDRDTRERLFEPFFTTKFQGRGLSMAAVYGVVKNHHGWLEVDSKPGMGTEVRLCLPASPAVGGQQENDDSQRKGTDCTILIIDDDEMLLKLNRIMLEMLGYRVLCAATARQAVELVQGAGGGIDLAIMDIELPDLRGDTLFRRLRAIEPGLPVIVYSGYALDESVQTLLDAGACSFLPKPFSIAALKAKVARMLHHGDGLGE